MSEWTDAIVGDRMAVDSSFADRVQASQFSSQEWGLIMTAAEFEIEDADDPERARIVADTAKLPAIMPELQTVRSQVATMGGATPGNTSAGAGSGGVLETIRSVLGFGSDEKPDQEELEAAERLVQAYADELQQHLDDADKWDRVRVAYQE